MQRCVSLGALRGAGFVCRHQSERKKAEEELAELQQNYDLLGQLLQDTKVGRPHPKAEQRIEGSMHPL